MQKEWITKLFKASEDIVFPHYACPVCGRESPDGKLCNNCHTNVIVPPYCAICGAHVTMDSTICDECKQGRGFDKSASVFEYVGKVSASILALKFRGAKYLAKEFATLLAERYAEFGVDADIVCCVPCTKEREKQRGYNQAKELAIEFCKLTGLPFAELLNKTKETGHQVELSREERLSNLAGSFAVTDKWAVRHRKVLIIDDVITTGSTLSACAKVLKRAHADKVYCLTVAKTELKTT